MLMLIMAFAPLFKSPLTDFEQMIIPNSRISGANKFCTNLYMRHADCLDAYGLRKGKLKCAELYYDLIECAHSTIQAKRSAEIQKERLKQFKEGKIEKLYMENPPLDAFLSI